MYLVPIAQSEERGTEVAEVSGSKPGGNNPYKGRMPEWSKGADLSSAGESLVGSNPTPFI
jgi:hypothetical protein